MRSLDVPDELASLGLLDGKVEMHFVEHAEPAHARPHVDGTAAHEPRAVTVLLDLVSDAYSRRTFNALGHCFSAARHRAVQLAGSECPTVLRRELSECPDSTWDLVVLGSDEAARTALADVARTIEVVRSSAAGLVALVAPDCSRWSALQGAAGFARDIHGDSAAATSALFLLVAALHAPTTLTCLEHQDVWRILGTASRPAVVAQAIWLRDERRLVFASAEDSRVVAKCRCLTVHPRLPQIGLSDLRRMVEAVRAHARTDCDITYQAPIDDTVEPYGHARLAVVSILCRLDANDS